jgi:hypothetical protein
MRFFRRAVYFRAVDRYGYNRFRTNQGVKGKAAVRRQKRP